MENELIPLAENPVAKANFKGSGRDGKTQDTVVPPAVAKAVFNELQLAEGTRTPTGSLGFLFVTVR
jgi:hypothetical protein